MTDKYDELIARLPDIAKAVNAFDSAEAQQRAFDLLAASLGMEPQTTTNPGTKKQESKKGPSKKPTKKAKSTVAGPKMLGDLVLNPPGSMSFKEFAAEKNPTSNDERSLVAVYYLEKELGLEGITVDHVFTAYKTAAWRPPANPRNQLQVAKSRHAWIQYDDQMNNITTTHAGSTYVDFDLPKSKTETP